MAKVGVFLAAAELSGNAMSKNIFLISCLNRFRSIKKNTIFMPLYGDILQANLFDLKNSVNRQINGNFVPLKGFGINFFGSYHSLIYLYISLIMI
jgi:hypothetical protein